MVMEEAEENGEKESCRQQLGPEEIINVKSAWTLAGDAGVSTVH